MIDVRYNRKEISLTVKGHAQSGEAGHDLVCAAATILVYTLAANVSGLCDDRAHARRPVIKLSEGDAIVKCSPVHGMKTVATLIFDSVCSGYEILASEYPENVRYTVEG